MAEKFIGSDNVALVLGGNIFYGHGFTGILQKAIKRKEGATIFGYYVKYPILTPIVSGEKSSFLG